jgi:hypothetical protein
MRITEIGDIGVGDAVVMRLLHLGIRGDRGFGEQHHAGFVDRVALAVCGDELTRVPAQPRAADRTAQQIQEGGDRAHLRIGRGRGIGSHEATAISGTLLWMLFM